MHRGSPQVPCKRRRWDEVGESSSFSSRTIRTSSPPPQPPQYLSLLPDEVLCRVIQFLPLRERIRVEKVSTRFREVARASWNDVKFLKMKDFAVGKRNGRGEFMDPLRKQVCRSVWSRAKGFVETIDFTNLSARPCRSRGISIIHPSVWCELAETEFRSLRTLKFGRNTLSNRNLLAKVWPEVMDSLNGGNIEKLVFSRSFGRTDYDEGLGLLLRHCPRLRHLEITGGRWTRGGFLTRLPNTIQTLILRKIFSRQVYLEPLFDGTPGKLPHLTHLELERIITSREFSIEKLCLCAPKLKVLLIPGLRKGIGRCITNYTGLQTLSQLEKLLITCSLEERNLSDFLAEFVDILAGPDSLCRTSLKSVSIKGLYQVFGLTAEQKEQNNRSLVKLARLNKLEVLELKPPPDSLPVSLFRALSSLPDFQALNQSQHDGDSDSYYSYNSSHYDSMSDYSLSDSDD